MPEQFTSPSEPEADENGRRFGWVGALGAGVAMAGVAAVVAGGPIARETANAWDALHGQVAAAEVVNKPVTTPFINGIAELPAGTEITEAQIAPTTQGSTGVDFYLAADSRGNPKTEVLSRQLDILNPMVISSGNRQAIIFGLPGSANKQNETVGIATASVSSISFIYGPSKARLVIPVSGTIGPEPNGETTSFSFPTFPNGFGSTYSENTGFNPTEMPTPQGEVPITRVGGAADIQTALEQLSPSQGITY